MTHSYLGEVFTLTRHGQQELQSGTTALTPAEITLLVRFDGKLTLGQIRDAMQPVADEDFFGTFRGLRDRRLITAAEADPVDAGLQVSLDAMGTSATEADVGLASMQRTGYYVRIAQASDGVRPAPAPGELHAVVVEDDPLLARFLETFLKLEAFTVRTAGDRASVVAELNKHPIPHVILLDVMLPDVDGFAILEKVKQHPALQKVPVIMLTGSDTRAAVIRGISGGAAGYLTKPVDPESLMRAVRTVVGLPQPPAELWTATSRHGST